jgi:hypothetical protein
MTHVKTLAVAAFLSVLAGAGAGHAAEGFVHAYQEQTDPRPSMQLHRRMEELARWIDENSAYGEIERMPAIIYLTHAELNYIAYNSTEQGYGAQDDVRALYMDRTIFLPDNFQLGRDDFIVVHELVHHLQHEAGMEFECVGASERDAYRLQGEFVEEVGTGTRPDPLFVLFVTECDAERW